MKVKPLTHPIEEIIADEWKSPALYKISKNDEEILSSSPNLKKITLSFEKGSQFEEHIHQKPQLLLVKEGKLTHYAEGKEYTQNPYDILIVPAHLPHSAIAEADLVIDVFHKTLSSK